jgi:hypothetical protein
MRLLVFIFILSFLGVGAQDKLFFTNGTSQKGFIISRAQDFIFFKTSDTSAIQKISKSDLLLIEDYKGNRYFFAAKSKNETLLNSSAQNTITSRNILSIQPVAILFGRGTLVYERLSKDSKIGLVIPFSITFDPFGSLYNSRIDTNQNSVKRISGVNFIAGLDLNFYVGRHENFKFFIGPRVRYGTDLFLRDVEGYTIQTQVGWKIGKPDKRFVQHLSVGFGFVRVLSSPAGRLIDPKQSYGWYSLNYRLGLKW